MTKSGYKTSEFWLTLAVIIGAVATIPLGGPAWIAGALAAGSAGCYTVSRTLAKTSGGTDAEKLDALTNSVRELTALGEVVRDLEQQKSNPPA